jgi:hypothetical protein
MAAGTCVGLAQAQTVYYSENFDSAVRNSRSSDPAVLAQCAGNNPTWTHNPPTGWVNDRCGVSTYYCHQLAAGTPCGANAYSASFHCNSCLPGDGRLEWEGWSFTNKNWWAASSGDQRRTEFTKGSGNVAVADGDTWDDTGHPTNCGWMNAFMTSKTIDLTGADPATLSFKFDSSWRPEGFDEQDLTNNQTGTIEAIYTVGGIDQPAVTVLHWDSNDSGPYYHGNFTNESVSIDAATLAAPVGATAVKFRFGYTQAGNDWWWAVDNLALTGTVGATPNSSIWTENFDGPDIVLQNPVDQLPNGCAVVYCGQNVYTHNAPHGASVTVASPAVGTPNGVADWRGWSFVDPAYWVCTSGHGTEAFAGGAGLIAVANGDHFDDVAHPDGPLDTTLTTPNINIASRTGNTLVLSYASCWRAEGNQTASIFADYTTPSGVQTVQVQNWASDGSSPNFHNDNTNEFVNTVLAVPAGSTSMKLRFQYVGGNNYWWGIDNIRVFEGLTSINYANNSPIQAKMALSNTTDYSLCSTPWSLTPPNNWLSVFDPCNPCNGACGVPEFSGWSFANKQWWVEIQGDQRRSEFTKGQGYIAVADSDTWDDAPNGQRVFNAFLTTEAIPLPSSVSSATLQFDSSWRAEGNDNGTINCATVAPRQNNQSALIDAIYTVNGVDQAPVNVLHWDSDSTGATGFFHPDNATSRNEHILLADAALHAPTGATAVKFKFSYILGRNNWWWAIDNLAFAINGSTTFQNDFENVPGRQQVISQQPPAASCQFFSTVDRQGGPSADNTGLIGCNNPDFTGFNAWLVDAWAKAEGGLRGQFGAQTAYICDFDAGACTGTAYFITPNYPIVGANADSVTLTFRSGWFSALNHSSTVEASFDGGTTWLPTLSWNPSNKATNTDETLTVSLHNPANSSQVKIRFGDRNSGWWAISGLSINGTVGTPVCRPDFNHNGILEVQDIFDFLNGWFSGSITTDYNLNGILEVQDIFDFLNSWFAGC